MWFRNLTGFNEQSPDQVRANLELIGNTMTSRVNGRSWNCGLLETPTLAEFRSRALENNVPSGRLAIREVIGDAKRLHTSPSNAGALFQVASQFNLLEMPGPSVTPEEGVGSYEGDITQGPACANAMNYVRPCVLVSNGIHRSRLMVAAISSPKHIALPCPWATQDSLKICGNSLPR